MNRYSVVSQSWATWQWFSQLWPVLDMLEWGHTTIATMGIDFLQTRQEFAKYQEIGLEYNLHVLVSYNYILQCCMSNAILLSGTCGNLDQWHCDTLLPPLWCYPHSGDPIHTFLLLSLLMMLEVELPTPVTLDSDWWDHPLVPASLMEDGLDQNQSALVCSHTATFNKYWVYQL